jgi:hypothetical protein
MQFQGLTSDGLEDWLCPTCGRRFLLRWPPDYKKIILDAGDESKIHSGGGRPLPQPAPAPSVPEILDASPAEEERLRPWLDWMERVDFESLWRE